MADAGDGFLHRCILAIAVLAALCGDARAQGRTDVVTAAERVLGEFPQIDEQQSEQQTEGARGTHQRTDAGRGRLAWR